MKMEDHFKETLNNAVANEPPVQDAWSRFERRVRRGLWMRGLRVAATAAVVAGAVWVAYPLVKSDNPVIVPPATQPPTSTPIVPDPYAGWHSSANADALWMVRYPSDWYGQDAPLPIFEGVNELQPPDVEALEKGLPTFAVTIRFAQGEKVYPPPSGEITTNETIVQRSDGRTAYRFDSADHGERTVVYRIEWDACAAGESTCHVVSGTLIVRLIAGNNTLWTRYGDVGEKIAQSIEHIEPGPIINSPSP